METKINYFYDCEFLEGKQDKRILGFKYGETPPTIDLISIGIVKESGEEYYAISKDFNLKEAWNRWEQRTGEGDRNNIQPRKYWIRDNVLTHVYADLINVHNAYLAKMERVGVYGSRKDVYEFTYKNLKYLLGLHGRSNRDIANDICAFIYGDDCGGSGMSAIEMATRYEISDKTKEPIFYGYYSAYDHVCLCFLYGKMINLPKGFPYYTKDLQQMVDESGLAAEWKDRVCPEPKGAHSAIEDARWNLKLYNALKKLSISKING